MSVNVLLTRLSREILDTAIFYPDRMLRKRVINPRGQQDYAHSGITSIRLKTAERSYGNRMSDVRRFHVLMERAPQLRKGNRSPLQRGAPMSRASVGQPNV
jgi:hypothetical protein